MKHRLVQLTGLLAIAIAAGTALAAHEAQPSSGWRFRFPGAVYTISNGLERNAILIFDRLFDGRLVRAGAVATGGRGTGGGLGNQGALVERQ